MKREYINTLPEEAGHIIPAFTLLYIDEDDNQITCECDFPWEMENYISEKESGEDCGIYVSRSIHKRQKH